MTFAEAIAQLVARANLDKQAVVKLELLAQVLQDVPALEELLSKLVRDKR